MNFKDFIGLEVCAAESILLKLGITNFKFVYYVDRKQQEFDKELVVAVREKDSVVELVVCRFKLGV